MKIDFNFQERFEDRHISPSETDVPAMLQTIGVDSIEQLIDKTIPENIRLKSPLALPPALSEVDYLNKMKQMASKNKVFKSYIGQGYYDVNLPTVILRNVLENPGWYTQYTPYQAEIAQGRLQALLNFQTAVIDLTGMEIANASLLDEATAAAEAMFMQYSLRKNKSANTFFVSENVFPQTLNVIRTRSESYGIELVVGDIKNIELNENIFGAIVQYPAADGEISGFKELADKLHAENMTLGVIADSMSLALLTPPGEWRADVVVGSTQRLRIPMGFGGPHAAYFATKEAYKRNIPGRIIGVTIDATGKYALRMALQTREQHIRRDKASSNICTAQALLAIMAGFYTVYHGPKGLKNIASRIHGTTLVLAKALESLGYSIKNKSFFDTLTVEVGNLLEPIHADALNSEINLRYDKEGTIGISIDETTKPNDLEALIKVFAKVKGQGNNEFSIDELAKDLETRVPENLQRQSEYLTHPVFNSYHSEHEMLRYIKSLEAKDLSLCHSMIPLGSCTMKLNATTEMIPLTWSEIGNIHPFAPSDQTNGYMQLFDELNQWLCEITGFKKMSFQPNSGAQGEYTGLMVIRAYHQANGQHQ